MQLIQEAAQLDEQLKKLANSSETDSGEGKKRKLSRSERRKMKADAAKAAMDDPQPDTDGSPASKKS